MKQIQVRLLGGFSVEVGDRRIDDSVSRSQKPLLLLAYLICNRECVVTAEELLCLCWEGEEKDDPANALRVVLHRARLMAERLEIGGGMELVRRERDGFRWSSHLPIHVDAEEFVRLHEEGKLARDDDAALESFRKALRLYRGDFMGRNSDSTWGRYMVSEHRGRYFRMVLSVLERLSAKGQREEAVQLARQVLKLEPQFEAASRHLMEELMALGLAREAAEEYERLRALLLRGNRSPEEETQRMYFRAVRLCGGEKIPVELYHMEKDENRSDTGVKICDFSYFRTFYKSAEYLIALCGIEIYNVLFTLEPVRDKQFSKRTVDRAMDTLIRQLKNELCRGDIITRCADGQLLAMIQANGYEQACMVCERQVARFCQTNPTTAVRLSYGVWRVEKKI